MGLPLPWAGPCLENPLPDTSVRPEGLWHSTGPIPPTQDPPWPLAPHFSPTRGWFLPAAAPTLHQFLHNKCFSRLQGRVLEWAHLGTVQHPLYGNGASIRPGSELLQQQGLCCAVLGPSLCPCRGRWWSRGSQALSCPSCRSLMSQPQFYQQPAALAVNPGAGSVSHQHSPISGLIVIIKFVSSHRETSRGSTAIKAAVKMLTTQEG